MTKQGMPHGPLRGSHLRQVSTGSLAESEDSGKEDFDPAHPDSTEELRQDIPIQRLFTLSIHEENFSKDDVVLNSSSGHTVHEGELLQLRGLKANYKLRDGNVHRDKVEDGDIDPLKQYLFTAKAVSQELLSKQPGLQISISRRIARTFRFERGNQVLVSKADHHKRNASHVEIVFRDQYLARADIWRLISTDLSNTCIYRGQSINFMGCINATIRTIFVHGKKVQSAFFHATTKPVFRSESARYVLFIQMSKEMWDFDAEGTGEIMFDKVINGFLPELFKRWQELKVKHLVSIVLFTRMIYDNKPEVGISEPKNEPGTTGKQDESSNSKDFYRVVVSDMASGEWANILNQLKREFRVFLRDISVQRPAAGDHLPLAADLSSGLAAAPDQVIAGRPTAATKGNVLEAINLASSQFSSDYIDRDLVRTGVSVVVISPGAGLFEVDYDLLVATTDNLIDNGVGIDLVCLSRMPLHSAPLFKYRAPQIELGNAIVASHGPVKLDDNTPTGSFMTKSGSPTPPSVSKSQETIGNGPTDSKKSTERKWSYGIPHWVDTSFWTSALDEDQKKTSLTKKLKEKSSFDAPQHKPFVPRVRMYELQMIGVMENAVSDISVPHLSQTFRPSPIQFQLPSSSHKPSPPQLGRIHIISRSYGSQNTHTSGHTPKLPSSILSSDSIHHKGHSSLFDWMDEYGDLVFRHPCIARKRARRIRSVKIHSKTRQRSAYSPSLLGTSIDTRRKASIYDHHGSDADGEGFLQQYAAERKASQMKAAGKGSIATGTTNDQVARSKSNLPSRKINFGPRGLGIGATKATASTSTDHGEVKSMLSRALKKEDAANHAGTDIFTQAKGRRSKDSSSVNSQQPQGENLEAAHSSESESQYSSRPIPIRKATAVQIKDQSKAEHRPGSHRDNTTELKHRLAALQDVQELEKGDPLTEPEDEDDAQPPTTLSPSTKLAPWLTILNPSNPSKTKASLASRLGRWHHVFPRPLKTSQIKWKSLCSPAAIPLTTEDFPSAEQLANKYQESTYYVEVPDNMELSETPRSLVTELVAFRLSRGFQMVVGQRLAESTASMSTALQPFEVFDGQILAISGSGIYLSRGSTIHKMTRLGGGKFEIKQFIRYGDATTKSAEAASVLYKPAIRSMLAEKYDVQPISIAPHKTNFDWKTIDSFVAGHERPKAEDFVENLRPWRARFVLIPIDSPSSSRRPIQMRNEDDEEEIRLEGIKKLTQVWQRFRYIPPEERRFQAPLRNKKDKNPLDIMYQTRNPSAIVAAELENVVEGDATGRPVQLLPESDLYQRSNFKIADLAATIQSEKGIRMLDRRWHWRLHYNCFIGIELTTWLLQNFRDVDTRNEAIDLGNELMKSGMFKHVEQRHNFRDGNYFYQIADDYRAARESRGWFGRGKQSVPSTPVSEDPPKDLPTTGRSRACSNSDSNSETSEPSTPTVSKRQKLGVALSKSLLYDVDHRKRSYRPELINLHYDRLHNPDNCYHIRVEWMNTTPKLIQDAVVSWATSVDRFGLRLVEVPLGEASSITSTHPFRSPYRVKLKQSPPVKQPQSYFDNTSFIPQPKTEKHFYQKAIMKRFNFVLDFEPASDFPLDVDVTYSWGKPDYHFPQYIHRSGMLIAQITHEGDFLLLANRLYNNRGGLANRFPQETGKSEDTNESDPHRGPGFFRFSPHRDSAHNLRGSPRESPYSSPSSRATLDVPPLSTSTLSNRGPLPNNQTSHSTPSPHKKPTVAPFKAEHLFRDFEAFCHDAKALEIFYDEMLSKSSTPGPNTPIVGGKTPSKGPQTPSRLPEKFTMESGIPSLTLPETLLEKMEEGKGRSKGEKGEKKPELRTKNVGESPRFGALTGAGD